MFDLLKKCVGNSGCISLYCIFAAMKQLSGNYAGEINTHLSNFNDIMLCDPSIELNALIIEYNIFKHLMQTMINSRDTDGAVYMPRYLISLNHNPYVVRSYLTEVYSLLKYVSKQQFTSVQAFSNEVCGDVYYTSGYIVNTIIAYKHTTVLDISANYGEFALTYLNKHFADTGNIMTNMHVYESDIIKNDIIRYQSSIRRNGDIILHKHRAIYCPEIGLNRLTFIFGNISTCTQLVDNLSVIDLIKHNSMYSPELCMEALYIILAYELVVDMGTVFLIISMNHELIPTIQNIYRICRVHTLHVMRQDTILFTFSKLNDVNTDVLDECLPLAYKIS
jgi:hypothetical protein